MIFIYFIQVFKVLFPFSTVRTNWNRNTVENCVFMLSNGKNEKNIVEKFSLIHVYENDQGFGRVFGRAFCLVFRLLKSFLWELLLKKMVFRKAFLGNQDELCLMSFFISFFHIMNLLYTRKAFLRTILLSWLLGELPWESYGWDQKKSEPEALPKIIKILQTAEKLEQVSPNRCHKHIQIGKYILF